MLLKVPMPPWKNTRIIYGGQEPNDGWWTLSSLWLMDHLTFKMVFPSQTPTLGTRKQERIDLKDDLKDRSIYVNFNDKK